ncbi:MAG: multiheme c-type cytochrome [Tepidisphaeraceae bacterium]
MKKTLGATLMSVALALGSLTIFGATSTTVPATLPALAGLPELPSWGRGAFQPHGANAVFASADGCALCHSASPNAKALWSTTGEDVSPYGLWRGTMMANASKDPYFHAQLAREAEVNPAIAEQAQQLCIRCHAPTAYHSYRIAGETKMPTMAAAAAHPLYGDGVNCTVCHQIQPDGLGTPATFDGQPVIKPGRTIFGPFADPGAMPMRAFSAFTAKQGHHIQSAALCASCHTLRTEHGGGGLFPEQSPYLEWQNSVYSDEMPNAKARNAQAKSCQECHMPDVGAMRIARNPGGGEFNIATREPVRGHAFVGGNAFMLDLLRENATELNLTSPAEALERIARATRAQLGHRTATVAVENAKRVKADNGGDLLEFDVVVTNLTGHKFPTGYPSRRAWVNTEVRVGRSVVFESGEPDAQGHIKNVEPASELGVPHVDVVTQPSEVPIYEMVAHDHDGKPTTLLTAMATRWKDNRLLPAGFAKEGPNAAETAPAGIGADANFVGGSDRVTYRIPLPADVQGSAVIVVRMYYQTVPPHWADALRPSNTEEAKRFVRMYDAAKSKQELIATAVGSVVE